ncbi:hypothetical protein GCM10010095_72220 [Streptomyces anthocyanicus]|uniref:DUF932 domain-containing protein n=1 Tax=Streptomyces violaceolatus TaxID=67378 RepID=A0ABN3TGP0_9ACTN|nr:MULTISPECIES: DUF932 domain-containing protein [Streptomyces]MBQ0953867.1 DUF932 domain-containing protein [Streptomyces sp. RK76]GGL76647.1 hypothetical protein GCM10010095_72220 [Streptomyces anthocyanicus]GHC32818.1 hypothetical protein GCM10010348_69580 [Streptomyces anthocyanicus]
MTQQFAERATDVAPTGARNAQLTDLVRILESQERHKLDVIAPASALRLREGNVHVEGVESLITEDGVTEVDGIYRPTAVADEGIADKLRIPLAYLRRMRTGNVPLLDENVNAWLRQEPERRFMLRAFRGEGEPGRPAEGVARALLSDSYKLMDNFDLLLAALDGVKQSGHPTRVTGCDLTDRRMYVRVESEAVAVQARELLRGYRSPFDGRSGDELPMISAGFVITNSEVGAGAYSITPRAVIQVCRNGLTMTKDVMRAVHLGGKQDEGVISWSGQTQRKTLELITSKTTDAVRTFLSREYVEAKLSEMEDAAGKRLAEPTKTIEHVTKTLSIGAEAKDMILAHFVQGGQMTAGGVMQAVTSTAQTLTDADQAAALEALAVPALTAAATHG